MMQQSGNLGPRERWISLLSGIGLTLVSLSRGSVGGRSLGALAGVGLISRGVAGHCGIKAALTGQTTLAEGMREQWRRTRSGLSTTPARGIESMEALYTAELQELYSAESQLGSLLQDLPDSLSNAASERVLRNYAAEIRTRCEDLERILTRGGANPRQHPDQGMQALQKETRKMAQMSPPNLRSAALISSLQRLIHHNIAGYGTVAAYAQTLGRVDEASRLAEYSDRDKAVDHELSSIAKEVVNPQARVEPREGEAFAGARPH